MLCKNGVSRNSAEPAGSRRRGGLSGPFRAAARPGEAPLNAAILPYYMEGEPEPMDINHYFSALSNFSIGSITLSNLLPALLVLDVCLLA